jgi:hypothetical protein
MLGAVLVVLLVAACGSDDASVAPSTSVPGGGGGEGITFAVDESDDGVRLRIRVGDNIRARLIVDGVEDPPWRASISNPGILTAGDRVRFRPSESGQAEPYDEYPFRAVRIGEADITFDQQRGPKTLTVTVIVFAD